MIKQWKWTGMIALSVVLLTGCGNQDIGKTKAEEIALSHANLAKEQVTFSKMEKENEDGKAVYEVEFYTKEKKEYDYTIDAKTGDILSYDEDAEDSQIPQAHSNNTSVEGITEEQVKGMLRERVPGGEFREFYMDSEDGRATYEGTVIYNDMEYEFEFDAQTGQLLRWDQESIFD